MNIQLKNRKIIKIIIIAAFALCLGFAITLGLFSRQVSVAQTSQFYMQSDQKIFSNASLEDNFCESSIIVILDDVLGGANKTHHPSTFGDIGIVAISDLTWQKYSSEVGDYFRQILKITLNQNCRQNVLDVIKTVETFNGIIYAGPNYIQIIDDYIYEQHADLFAPFSGNHPTPTYTNQWALHGTHGLQAEQAWEITRGSRNIRVGVADGGVALHPTLNANVARPGWDFHGGDPAFDFRGHGTAMAGIIGATGNAVGITGVAREVSIVPFRTAIGNRSMQSHTIVGAVNEARNRWNNPATRVSIMNLSANWFGVTSGGIQILQAINNAPNILFAWSADNNTLNLDNTSLFPRIAEFTNVSNVISVGAHTQTRAKVASSNYGQNSVSIFAPGASTWVTMSPVEDRNDRTPNSISVCGRYRLSGGGTSGAAAHISGVAALMLSANPTLSAVQLRTLMLSSADMSYIDTPTGGRQRVRFVNAKSAVQAAIFNFVPIGTTNNITISARSGAALPATLNIPANVNIDGTQRTITQIGASAFASNTNLSTITLPPHNYFYWDRSLCSYIRFKNGYFCV